MRFSQDQRQRDGNRPEGLPAPPGTIPITYSYTNYDHLGRVVESGEALLDPALRGNAPPLPLSEVNNSPNSPIFPQYGQRTYTRTIYSSRVQNLNYLHQPNRGQRYLRNRVSYTVTEANVATFYSYDPHGNVEWMASHIPGLGMNFVGYEYDLIGGKMQRVLYDSGMGDMFGHRYRYDEDNRLLRVETTRDGELWDRDGEQEYYRHGPLRRLELGEDSIQGIDYTYTIHGWLKGMNHSMLAAASDPGGDGTLSNGMKYPQDGYGMVLGYYTGDYARKYESGSSVKYSLFNTKNGGGYPAIGNQLFGMNLYNGNISSWRHQSQYGAGMPGQMTYPIQVGNMYEYDVLNRLVESKFRWYSGSTWLPGGWSVADYRESFSYDANGNIVTAVRHGKWDGGSGSTLIDNLSYQYDYNPLLGGVQRNRLRYVSDAATGPAGTGPLVQTTAVGDLEDQSGPWVVGATPVPVGMLQAYEYDGSGNLLHDRSEGTLIRWNAQGKVVEVRKDQFGVSQTTKFWYNAAGNRVKKQVFNHIAPLENGADTSSVTYYVRDANEAVMAIYQQKVIHTSGMFGCLRKPSNNVGGDSDLDGVVDGGCDNCHPSMPGTLPGGEWNPWQEDYDRDGVGDACDPCPFQFTPPNTPCVGPPFLPEPEVWTGIAVSTTLAELPIYGSERLGLMRPNAMRDTNFYPGAIFTRQLDKKAYELKDHLGNVRVVVSDLKGKEVTGIIARVKSVNNYYAFGMLEEGMSGSSGGYRYGYNGKEMDNELKGEGNSIDYGARMYDPRLGRFMSRDPLFRNYPDISAYIYANNTPIVAIDNNGEYPIWTHFKMTYFALRQAGVSIATSIRIAHYASTYADNPEEKYITLNIIIAQSEYAVNHAVKLFNPSIELIDPNVLKKNVRKYGSYDDTEKSQHDDKIESVSIHAMMAYFEDITPEEAVNRALYGGTFNDKNGKPVIIEGALNVIARLHGKNIENLTEQEAKDLGVAFHTIQDAVPHKGARWVYGSKDKADALGHHNEHPDIGCTIGDGASVATEQTNQVVDQFIECQEE